MSPDQISAADREECLNEVLLAYVEAKQGGQEPDHWQFLAAHPELRDDLEAFFASHDEVERLAAPLRQAGKGSAGGEAPYGVTPADVGQLGDFRLLREAGRGGMGVVYEAEQISLRRIALKIQPFAAASDPRQLQRFRNESLAAANLHHPHIVPVYFVGCERGVHYYAMQFIEGRSLATLIADRRRSPGASGPSTVVLGPSDGQTAPLDSRSSETTSFLRWAVNLARQAALALEHAHQAGVVHRDVKPANLMLDVRGQPWVTDFGLARVNGDAGVTMTGEMLGTLRYASPEQALARRGVVDHRSDVYSLGATLYELLTLRPIFEGRDRNELLRQIADDDPLPPGPAFGERVDSGQRGGVGGPAWDGGVRKRLLRSVLAYHQEFLAQRRDDPNAQAELQDAMRRVEKILGDLAVLRAASKLYLLCQLAVLGDLGLDDEQRAEMKELTDRVGKQWVESFQEAGRLPQAQRAKQILERARANEADRSKDACMESPANEQVLGVLTAEQARRWREMTGKPLPPALTPFAPPPVQKKPSQ